jgi:hypothetical protein
MQKRYQYYNQLQISILYFGLSLLALESDRVSVPGLKLFILE